MKTTCPVTGIKPAPISYYQVYRKHSFKKKLPGFHVDSHLAYLKNKVELN